MDRLSEKTLVDIPTRIVRPLYDRAAVPTRIVHLGAGSFFRSHTAVYTDNVMQGGDARWGILGASWHKPALANALGPQDGLYTLLVTDTGVKKARVVGSVKQVVCMADRRAAVLAALSSPATQIVSLTVTPQGYCYDTHQQTLDDSLADVRFDLNEPWKPRTVIGVLAWSIFQRKESGAPPFTLLSCDNMHNNGKVLQRALESYIERVQQILNDPGLLQYFLDRYACPCTLVDRITPPSRPAHLVDVQEMLGMHDAAPVVAEPFSQWVIQDWFSGERPDWDAAGATLASSIDPFEERRVRLQEAGYAAIAYLGGLAGYKTVASAVQNPEIARFISDFLDDAILTLGRQARHNADDYKRELLKRFANPLLNQSTEEWAADGSQKLPELVLKPLQQRLKHGHDIQRHAMVTAAWMRSLLGRNELQENLDIRDPLLEDLTVALGKAGTAPRSLVGMLVAFRDIFGDDLPDTPEFVQAVTAALQALRAQGVVPALAALNQTMTAT